MNQPDRANLLDQFRTGYAEVEAARVREHALGGGPSDVQAAGALVVDAGIGDGRCRLGRAA